MFILYRAPIGHAKYLYRAEMQCAQYHKYKVQYSSVENTGCPQYSSQGSLFRYRSMVATCPRNFESYRALHSTDKSNQLEPQSVIVAMEAVKKMY